MPMHSEADGQAARRSKTLLQLPVLSSGRECTFRLDGLASRRVGYCVGV